MTTPTFGIFDHIEGIPGTSTSQLFSDRIKMVQLVEEGGFTGYHVAEHHGSDLCLAPNQEVFLAAVSQATSTIRIGPMVKLLPLHHPTRLLEDLAVLDQLSGGRVDFGVGRGVAPIEHYWFGSDWPHSRDRFEDHLGILINAMETGVLSSANSPTHEFPDMDVATEMFQSTIPFWYPGSPTLAGRYGMNLMWPGPVTAEVHDLYTSTWYKHRGDTLRVDGPDSVPRVGCAMVMAIDDQEDRALEVARRGMEGLMRRTFGVHQRDAEVLPADEVDAALGPLRRILSHIEEAIAAGAGTSGQITERLGGLLETGLTDYICLQVPTGDMTHEEAMTTLDIFIEQVKPELETISIS